jgi:hypothetical protein
MPPRPQPGIVVALRGIVHLQGLADVALMNDKRAGTVGQARRLEGFEIAIAPPVADLSLRYMAHVQNIGDTPWATEGSFVGTRGRSLRLEGFAIEATGAAAQYYVVQYRAWLQDLGATQWCVGPAFCGTRGAHRRVEAIEVDVRSAGGLTGYWMADDGCQYYISQKNAQVWWAGLDNHGWFHDGLTTCNVFFGSIPQMVQPPGRPIVDHTLEGDWFDVPRATAMSSGHVSLRIIRDAAGAPTTLLRQWASGGLKVTRLQKSDQAVGGDSQLWFDKPIHDMPAEAFLQMAVRNTGDPLHDDLRQPFRNVVVAYGWVAGEAGWVAGEASEGLRPPFTLQNPGWGTALPDFFDTDHDGDHDANFNLVLNVQAWADYLQRTADGGWLPGRDPRTIEGKLQVGSPRNRIHCEMIMYGVTSEDTYYQRVYPGWGDSQGNSVLVNGRPVNGTLDIGARVPNKDPAEWLLAGLGGQKLSPGSYVRVTGVLVLDCGHYDWAKVGHPCYDDPNDEDDMAHKNLEIHPVFGVDLINATPTANLSGTWGAGNGDTIYLHQVGQTVAGLRLPALGAGSGATVLHGIREGDEIRGTWRRVSIPDAGGAWRAAVVNASPRLNNLVLIVASPDDGWWDKLSDAVDQTPTMRIELVGYGADDARRGLQGCEGGAASFTVTGPTFPADTELTYSWTVRGTTNVTESHAQSITLQDLPAAGTVIALSVVVVVADDTASQYEASLDFVVLPALSPDERAWLEMMRLLARLGKLAPPGPLPAANLPDPVPAEVRQMIRDLRAPTLTEIKDHLRAVEDVVRRLTQESEYE